MNHPVVENLTNWNTVDLEDYVAEAVTHATVVPPAVVKFVHWRGSDLVVESVYDHETGVATVKIPKPARFDENVIDKLAATLDGGANQLPKDYRNHVAHAIQCVVNKRWARCPGWSTRKQQGATWATNMPLRTQKKRKRNAPESLRRELLVLEARMSHIRAEADLQIAELSAKADAKRSKLKALEAAT